MAEVSTPLLIVLTAVGALWAAAVAWAAVELVDALVWWVRRWGARRARKPGRAVRPRGRR